MKKHIIRNAGAFVLLLAASFFNEWGEDVGLYFCDILKIKHFLFWTMFFNYSIETPIIEEFFRKIFPSEFTFQIIVLETTMSMFEMNTVGELTVFNVVFILLIKIFMHCSFYILQKEVGFGHAVLLHATNNLCNPLSYLGGLGEYIGICIRMVCIVIGTIICVKHWWNKNSKGVLCNG